MVPFSLGAKQRPVFHGYIEINVYLWYFLIDAYGRSEIRGLPA